MSLVIQLPFRCTSEESGIAIALPSIGHFAYQAASLFVAAVQSHGDAYERREQLLKHANENSC